MALRGIPGLDVSRIWRKIDVKKDPKVAVSLLLDCSGSMTEKAGDKTRIRLAQEAACALSEVMRNLSIPHEIIGHTTWPEGLKKLDLNSENVATFSRFQPFQGYWFKAFEDRKPPVSVFTDFEMADNVDGEAVEWAALRLADRREKTKILIVISDGMPQANLCNVAELERHLLLTCRSVEAREDEGLFLFGIGIGNERVKDFYKNAGVYNEIGDLPKIVLGQVEYVLQKLGTLG